LGGVLGSLLSFRLRIVHSSTNALPITVVLPSVVPVSFAKIIRHHRLLSSPNRSVITKLGKYLSMVSTSIDSNMLTSDNTEEGPGGMLFDLDFNNPSANIVLKSSYSLLFRIEDYHLKSNR
jgi:hypothetical protein